MTRLDMKMNAKKQISGKIGLMFIVTIIIAIIDVVLNFIPIVGSIASFLVSACFSLSLCIMYLKMTKDEKVELKDAFSGFSNAVSAIILTLLVGIYTFLWTLLLIIPGIVKGLAYSMSTYILADNPDMTASECIAKSCEIMNGHKMDLFILHLSFIPWYFLCGITFGIAYIYVAPYMSATVANFYNSIKE
ncbi:MAG: DUF975 family protein [Clostridia bacterium]|nr:DUF975 family protein [Clostridia bacterium]